VQRRPEAIAGTAEVMSDRGRVEAGIDAAEEDVEAGRDDVRDRLSMCCCNLFACRFQ